MDDADDAEDAVAAELVPTAPAGEITPHEAPVRDRLAAAWLIGQRSANTRAAYARDLADWFAWCDRSGLDVLAVRRLHVDTWREVLLHGEHPRRLLRVHRGAETHRGVELVPLRRRRGTAPRAG